MASTLLALLLILLPGCTGPGPRGSGTGAGGGTSGVFPGLPGLPGDPGVTRPLPRPAGPAALLGLEPGWGPSRRDLDRAARAVRRLDVATLAGQVIWARVDGPLAGVEARRLRLGGLVVLGTRDATALRREVAALRPPTAGVPVPVVAVDQEGGPVVRVSGGGPPLPAAMAVGAVDDPDLARRAGRALARQTVAAGVVWDLAPVLDVVDPDADVTLGARSLGADPRRVAVLGEEVARGLWDGGAVPVVKHFPGLGSVDVDPHRGLPVQRRAPSVLRALDEAPFAALVRRGIPAVMVAHVVVPGWDPTAPVSLSRAGISGELRGRLGFAGVVMTDALDMGALRRPAGPARTGPPPVVAALRAGADVALMPPDPSAARDAVVAAVRDGVLTRRRLEQAVARVWALRALRAATPPVPAPGTDRVAVELARRAITQVRGPCAPASVDPRMAVRWIGPTPWRDAAQRAWARVGGRSVRTRSPRDTVTVRLLAGPPAPARRGAEPPGVAVSVGDPRWLRGSGARRQVAIWGDAPADWAALARVLHGDAVAPGRLPAPWSGTGDAGCG
ncbi:glycoside hydrolase family 3 N-terminal domain-containing protein [Nocardioides sp.]|uniref:glycoside hydrolase family 3 N-terminal domain-containing protein n=1 Tax=Nocardioides sp. TaxID=35761 RepID=UPI003515E03E